MFFFINILITIKFIFLIDNNIIFIRIIRKIIIYG